MLRATWLFQNRSTRKPWASSQLVRIRVARGAGRVLPAV